MKRPNLRAVPSVPAERSGPDDVLVSYERALKVLKLRLGTFVEPARIEEALREALPAKQRARLEGRQ